MEYYTTISPVAGVVYLEFLKEKEKKKRKRTEQEQNYSSGT